MGLFPTNAVNGQEVTNAGGTTFKYVAADDKWIIKSAGVISDTAYNATSWDANTDVATKNAIRDKFESLPGPNHNDLPGLNAGDDYEHITQTQKNTLANIGDAYKIETKEIDTTGIADTKILKYNGTKWVITDDSTGGAGGDTDALHDNVANEITAIAEKTTPAVNDEIVIEDSGAGYVKKSLKITNLVNDSIYSSSWNAVTTIAPSKNRVYDKIETTVWKIHGAVNWIPVNWETSGTDNCWFIRDGYGGHIRFGWGGAPTLDVTFFVPQDYVAGSNMYIYFMFQAAAADTPNQHDVQFEQFGDNQACDSSPDGWTSSGAFTGLTTGAGATWQLCYITINGSSFTMTPGKMVYGKIIIEGGGQYINTAAWTLKYQGKAIENEM